MQLCDVRRTQEKRQSGPAIRWLQPEPAPADAQRPASTCVPVPRSSAASASVLDPLDWAALAWAAARRASSAASGCACPASTHTRSDSLQDASTGASRSVKRCAASTKSTGSASRIDERGGNRGREPKQGGAPGVAGPLAFSEQVQTRGQPPGWRTQSDQQGLAEPTGQSGDPGQSGQFGVERDLAQPASRILGACGDQIDDGSGQRRQQSMGGVGAPMVFDLIERRPGRLEFPVQQGDQAGAEQPGGIPGRLDPAAGPAGRHPAAACRCRAWVAARTGTDQCWAAAAASTAQPPSDTRTDPERDHRSFTTAAVPEIRLVQQALGLPESVSGGAEGAFPGSAPGLGQRQPGVVPDDRSGQQQITAAHRFVGRGAAGLDDPGDRAPVLGAGIGPGRAAEIPVRLQQGGAARIPLPRTGDAVLLDQRPFQVAAQHLVIAEGFAVVLGRGEQLALLEFVENLGGCR